MLKASHILKGGFTKFEMQFQAQYTISHLKFDNLVSFFLVLRPGCATMLEIKAVKICCLQVNLHRLKVKANYLNNIFQLALFYDHVPRPFNIKVQHKIQ